MDIKHIASRIDRIARIVDGWSRSGEIPAVERGIVEHTLAELYEIVRFDTPAPAEPAPQTAIDIEHIFGTPAAKAPEAEEAAEAEPEPVAEPEAESETDHKPESEPEPVAEPEPQPAAEAVAEPESELEPAVEPKPQPEPAAETEAVAAPEPEPEPAAEPEPQSEPVKQTSLFDMEVVRRPRSGGSRKIIMSLYGEPAARRTTEHSAARKAEKPVPKPAAQETKPVEAEKSEKLETPADHTAVLGEVINAGKTTVADAIAATQPEDVASRIVHSDRIDDLNRAIGVNDKFIMIRDLFDGDSEAYAKAISDLNSFADFDECLVYIASNYRWNPDSDGTRMLMDLLTRKLL